MATPTPPLKLFLFTTCGPTARPDYHVVQAINSAQASVVIEAELEEGELRACKDFIREKITQRKDK